jgi:hypothetical protein
VPASLYPGNKLAYLYPRISLPTFMQGPALHLFLGPSLLSVLKEQLATYILDQSGFSVWMTKPASLHQRSGFLPVYLDQPPYLYPRLCLLACI